MPSNITPNMSLVVPTVGQEPGPQYATDVNTSLNLVDGHNHTPGFGVPIPTAGLSINADLSINNNRLIGPKSIPLTPQASPLTAVSPDISALYVSGVDLYYNDGNGNQIRVTQSGSVTGAPGSITGLTPPASASYSSGSSTFVWQSDVDTAANMDMGSIILRNLTANSNGITISAPNALAANYTITLPPAVPISQATLEMSSSGNITAVPNVSKMFVISSNCGVASNNTAGDVLIPNMSVTITSYGRPVVVGFVGNSGNNFMGLTTSSNPDFCYFSILRDGTKLVQSFIEGDTAVALPVSSMLVVDPVGPGTYTYTAEFTGSGTSNAQISFASLYAYEI